MIFDYELDYYIRYGELPGREEKEPVVIGMCVCGNEIYEDTEEVYWRVPNGFDFDIVCHECIEEYKEEYFSNFKAWA